MSFQVLIDKIPDMMNPFALGFSFMADISVADTCLVVIKLTFPSLMNDMNYNVQLILYFYSA